MKHIDKLRSDFELSNAIYAMSSAEHRLTMKRLDLAAEVRRSGGSWATPLVSQLSNEARELERAFRAAAEVVRKLKTKRYKPPTEPVRCLIDYVEGGPCQGQSHD